MPNSFEKIKDIVRISPILIGPAIGATVLADYADRGYSQSQVENIESYIAEIDAKNHELIGPANECQINVYDFLREDDSFPLDRQEIMETLSASCENPNAVTEDDTRLMESYMADLSAAVNDRNDLVLDKKSVTVVERIAFGGFGLSLGFIASSGLFIIRGRSRDINRTNDTRPATI
jgi:hypothetical protein